MIDFIDYMEQIATSLKEIAHNPETKPRFFRVSSIANVEELLQNMPFINSDPFIMVTDKPAGVVGDAYNCDQYTDTPFHTFYIGQHSPVGDGNLKEAVSKQCKLIGLKILSKMLKDKASAVEGLDYLNFERISYDSFGPIGNNYHGIYFDITLIQDAELVYDANDWLS